MINSSTVSGPNGSGVASLMVGIADDERAILTLHGDQLHILKAVSAQLDRNFGDGCARVISALPALARAALCAGSTAIRIPWNYGRVRRQCAQ